MPCNIELPNGRKIGSGEPAFIVAEIGQNHQGDAYTATRLMKEAHDAGVDAVKFCKRHLSSDMTQEMMDEPYAGPQSFGATYGEHRAALELEAEEYMHLKERMAYNEWPEVMFATACDERSVDILEAAINPPLYKIASRDLDNLPLIDYVARLGKPVVLSTGMARDLDEVAEAINTIKQHHNRIVVCYCVSEYPTPNEHVQLETIQYLAHNFGVHIGYSDHTAGITMCQAAATLGAVYIEKHLTLARAMKGTDHAASLEPDGMRRMVRNIRAVEAAMLLGPVADVEATRKKLGRSICAAVDIEKYRVITEDMLCLKSPGTGVPWGHRGAVVKHYPVRDIKAGEEIECGDLLPDYVVHGTGVPA